jgi:hypothetical protein
MYKIAMNRRTQNVAVNLCYKQLKTENKIESLSEFVTLEFKPKLENRVFDIFYL